jgi:hypothetical protein
MKSTHYFSFLNQLVKIQTLTKLLLFVFILLILSCQRKDVSYKPHSLGAPGELLVVVDSPHWKAQTGQLIKGFVENEFPGLPQPEHLFKKSYIPHRVFDRHFKTYRNILLVYFDAMPFMGEVKFVKSRWALNQYIVEIHATDADNFKSLFQTHQQKMRDHFYNGDISTLIKAYKNKTVELSKRVADIHGLKLDFPLGYQLKKDTSFFSWFAREYVDNQQGVFVYNYHRDSIVDFEPNSLLLIRNKMLQQQVPGPAMGSFMTTEEQFPVLVNNVHIAGQQWIELRGLWKVQGDFMGGPFVDYYLDDKENNQVVVLSGYVYAPSKSNKSLYVRQVEAIMRSLIWEKS